MDSNFFRHSTAEKLSSPSQLSKLLVVIRLKGWIVLLTLSLIICAILVWSFVGQIPIIVKGDGVLLAPGAQFPVHSPFEGLVEKVLVKMNQEVPTGTPLIRFSNGRVIPAPHEGQVFQMNVEEGQSVKVGESLLWFQTTIYPNQLQFYSFIPTWMSERVEKGMEATIDLQAVDNQKYGGVKGSVKQVSLYAVSAASAPLKVIPAEQLRENLTRGRSVKLIIIEPKLDSQDQSRLAWTFGQGPSELPQPGLMGTARITVENKRPISYLIPGTL